MTASQNSNRIQFNHFRFSNVKPKQNLQRSKGWEKILLLSSSLGDDTSSTQRLRRYESDVQNSPSTSTSVRTSFPRATKDKDVTQQAGVPSMSSPLAKSPSSRVLTNTRLASEETALPRILLFLLLNMWTTFTSHVALDSGVPTRERSSPYAELAGKIAVKGKSQSRIIIHGVLGVVGIHSKRM